MNSKIEYLRKKANLLTTSPGVYLMKDSKGNIIYIGKAKRLKNRVVSYFRENSSHNEKVLKMVSLVDDFDYIVTDSEFEALVLECSLIKQHTPKYNILLKDDKGYHYIKISNGDYPKITAEKQKTGGGEYIGPYTSGYGITRAVDEANGAFMLYTCNKKFPRDFKKGRPCLNYHIKRCCGVCLGKIGKEEYQENVNRALEYIKNGTRESVENLKARMQTYSDNMEFEKAAKIRDQIIAIERITQKQKVVDGKKTSQDVVATSQLYGATCVVVIKYRGGMLVDKQHHIFENTVTDDELYSDFLISYYSDNDDIPKIVLVDRDFEDREVITEFLSNLKGSKVQMSVPQKAQPKQLVDMAQNNATNQLVQRFKRPGKDTVLLDDLAGLLGLSKRPDYIEAYDVSNLGDTNIVCGMIAVSGGNFLKSAYKKFAIKEHTMQDDYGAMSEAITRRFNRYFEQKEKGTGFGKMPDLLLLDGGKGHVSAISKVVADMGLDIPIFGMVKDDKHRTRAIVSPDGEIALSMHKNLFKFITKIQDEVHRYSITYQAKKHKKSSFALEIESIQGIGPKKAQAIMKHFKTKNSISQAPIEQIQQVAKVPLETAQKIKELFS